MYQSQTHTHPGDFRSSYLIINFVAAKSEIIGTIMGGKSQTHNFGYHFSLNMHWKLQVHIDSAQGTRLKLQHRKIAILVRNRYLATSCGYAYREHAAVGSKFLPSTTSRVIRATPITWLLYQT